MKIKVCNFEDVGYNEVKRFVVGTYDLAVYNLDGRFYVTDDTCTHGPSSLADGFIDGDIIECAFHSGAFHIPTGQPSKFPCTIPVQTYTVSQIGDEVFIEI